MNEDTLSDGSDSLSTALMRMKLRALVNVTLDAGGSWAIDFPGSEGISLNVVQKGECAISVATHRETVRLRAGDCFLMTGGKEFTIEGGISAKKRKRAEELFAHARNGVMTHQGGGDVLIARTVFRFEGHLPQIVFGRLPPVIHVHGDSDQAAVLRWSLERFSAELRGRAIVIP